MTKSDLLEMNNFFDSLNFSALKDLDELFTLTMLKFPSSSKEEILTCLTEYSKISKTPSETPIDKVSLAMKVGAVYIDK